MIAGLGTVFGTLDSSSVSISLPRLSETFGIDPSLTLWITLIYILTSAGLLFTMGWLGDVIGRRRLYTIGFFIVSASLAFCALAPGFGLLLVFRALEGVGASMIQANANAIIAENFAPGERARAVGIQGVAVGLGLAGGPILGGVVMDYLDWRALFYLRIPLSAVGMVMAWLVLRDADATSRRSAPDVTGAVLLFGSVGGFLLAVNQLGRVGWESPMVWVGAVAFLALLPLFLHRQRKAEHPLVDLKLFALPRFRMAILSMMGFFLAWAGIVYIAPFYLQRGLGYSAAAAGLFLSSFHIMRMVGSPLSGILATRFSARTIASIALVMTLVGTVLLGRLGLNPPVVAIMLCLVLAGLGAAFFEPPNTASILEATPRNRMGTGSAAVPAGRQIAMSSGIAATGALFAARQHARQDSLTAQGETDAFAVSNALAYGDALWLSAACAALALTASVLRPSGRADSEMMRLRW
jgi:EmrB/QacA subfamily drug resistance transporter